MQVQRINFPDILHDNESTYFGYLEGLIESIDMDSSMMIYRGHGSISVRISPSEPKYFSELLSVVKRFHTLLGIQVEFSKSMKILSSISYNINF